MRSRHARLILAVAALAANSRPAHAELIEAPPIVITQLTHAFIYDSESGEFRVQDFIAIPGTGYTCSGFTAAIGTGDVVRVRIVPPSGKKFRLRALGGISGFQVDIHWENPDGLFTHTNPFTVTFENATATAPALQPFTLVWACAAVVQFVADFQVLNDVEFTALRVDITQHEALAKLPRTYADLGSDSIPSIAGFHDTMSPTFPAFEIIDDTAVPSATTSWGRLKSLYR